MNTALLQIVPRLPGEREAVGDYAGTLARKLQERAGCETTFVTGDQLNARSYQFDHVILHYVNYGYQSRGVPIRLLSILRELRQACAGKFVTVFHELYASSPPWSSAFWLRPLQASDMVVTTLQRDFSRHIANRTARRGLGRDHVNIAVTAFVRQSDDA